MDKFCFYFAVGVGHIVSERQVCLGWVTEYALPTVLSPLHCLNPRLVIIGVDFDLDTTLRLCEASVHIQAQILLVIESVSTVEFVVVRA